MRFAHHAGKCFEANHIFTAIDPNGRARYRLSLEEHTTIVEWCLDALGEGYGRWVIGEAEVYIVEDTDALMFKMRWC